MIEFQIPALMADFGECSITKWYTLFAAGKDDHPNKMRFTGTLLQLDTASDQSPHGAEGHKILVPKSICTSAKLRDLVGMGLNYRSDLEGHNVRNKVGVITKAWLDGNAVKVKGIIWKKDFPEAVKDLKGRKLGMSMELANVRIRDKDEEVWHLEDLTFTGATTLWPRSAAYHKTSLAASQAEGRETQMPDKKKEKERQAPAAEGLTLANIQAAFSNALSPISSALKSMLDGQTLLQTSIGTLAAAAESQREDIELEEILAGNAGSGGGAAADEGLAAAKKVKAAKPPKPDVEAAAPAASDSSSSDEEDDDDSESSMSAEAASGSASASVESEAEVPVAAKTVAVPKVKIKAGGGKKGVTEVAAAGSKQKYIDALQGAGETIRTLQAEAAKKDKKLAKQAERMKTILAQNEMYAEQMERKTIPGDLGLLLQKGGYDAAELFASGKKLSVGEVDEMLGGMQLDTTDRMKFKNDLYQRGLMERGDIVRSYTN